MPHLTAICCTTVMMLSDVSCGQKLEAWDTTLFFLINSTLRTAFLDPLMLFITNKWNFVIPGVCFLVYWLTTGAREKKRWRLAVAAMLLIVVADASASAIKGVVNRLRPCAVLTGVSSLLPCSNSASFPSSHAVNIFALAAFIAFFDRKHAWLWLSLASLVGYSRIYLGMHYPLDVVAGALLGVTFGTATAVGTRKLLRVTIQPDQS